MDIVYDKRIKNANSEKFYQEALKLAGDSSSDDVELVETDFHK